jgi:formate dehydrogenase assembly factor FdhD
MNAQTVEVDLIAEPQEDRTILIGYLIGDGHIGEGDELVTYDVLGVGRTLRVEVTYQNELYNIDCDIRPIVSRAVMMAKSGAVPV